MKLLLACWQDSRRVRGFARLRHTYKVYRAMRWINDVFINEERFTCFNSPWHMLAREDMRRAYEEGRFKPLGGERCL